MCTFVDGENKQQRRNAQQNIDYGFSGKIEQLKSPRFSYYTLPWQEKQGILKRILRNQEERKNKDAFNDLIRPIKIRGQEARV